jgi:hypothetical protein
MSTEKLTVTLTGRRPVTITKADWPVIAEAKAWDNTYEFQGQKWRLVVRQHADGRAIVYGVHTSNYQNAKDARGGELLEPGDDIPVAVHRVAESLDFEARLAEECIADLPAEEI